MEHVRDDANRAWVGRTSGELAAERGGDALDTFLELSIAEDLATSWRTRTTGDRQEVHRRTSSRRRCAIRW